MGKAIKSGFADLYKQVRQRKRGRYNFLNRDAHQYVSGTEGDSNVSLLVYLRRSRFTVFCLGNSPNSFCYSIT